MLACKKSGNTQTLPYPLLQWNERQYLIEGLCVQCAPDGQALAGHHQLLQVRLVVVDCREQCIAEAARQVWLGRRVLQSAESEQMAQMPPYFAPLRIRKVLSSDRHS
jgi:hypothetical protein